MYRDYKSYKELCQFLITKVNGRIIAECAGPNDHILEWWQIKNEILIIVIYDEGYEVYAPITKSLKIADTLKAILERSKS